MAVNSFDPTTGRPIFVDTDAPDIKVDPTKAAEYAADVGNRIMRANLAALDSYAYKRKGLRGKALDTGIEYEHTGTGWIPIQARIAGRVKRSSQATTFLSSGYNNVASSTGAGTTFWIPDVAQGIAAYNNGWTLPITSRYLVSYEFRATASFLVGLSVNSAAATPPLILTQTPAAVQGVAAATMSATVKLNAGDVLRPYLLAASGTPAWSVDLGFFSVEWIGFD